MEPYKYQPDSALIKRIKSFLWRIGMMTAAFIATAVADNIGMLEFSPVVTTVLGLILGEVSKALNSRGSYVS